MEVKNLYIRNMKTEDFKENEYLESCLAELKANGVNIAVVKLDDLINWGRSNSVWPLTFATSCCGIEFMSLGAARYDFARFGWEVTRNSPRQADVIFCCGTIVHKMAPVLKRLYDQMAEPKYVMAFGACAIGGGPFKSSYHTVMGVDQIIPVDVYIPGCPPRPDAMIYGMMQLARKIKVEEFFSLSKEPKFDWRKQIKDLKNLVRRTISDNLEIIKILKDMKGGKQ
jgi:NADH-quinone oxidoreductase subunit B